MRILIADEDTQRADRLVSSLRGLGHELEHVDAAGRAEAAHESRAFDLVIVDLGLGAGAGAGLIARIRRHDATIALLALARGTSVDERVEALNQGADDCVSAPVSIEEVVALVRVWYRRTLGAGGNIVSYGPLSIDASDGAVFIEGQPVRMSRRDLSILEVLVQRKGARRDQGPLDGPPVRLGRRCQHELPRSFRLSLAKEDRAGVGAHQDAARAGLLPAAAQLKPSSLVEAFGARPDRMATERVSGGSPSELTASSTIRLRASPGAGRIGRLAAQAPPTRPALRRGPARTADPPRSGRGPRGPRGPRGHGVASVAPDAQSF